MLVNHSRLGQLINNYMPLAGTNVRYSEFGMTTVEVGDTITFTCDSQKAEAKWKTDSGIWTNF